MNDPALGYLLLGLGLVLILVLVFAVTSGATRTQMARPRPPSGVHLPSPSLLPVLFSVGAALIGAGLAFGSDEAPVNWWLLVPGLLLLVLSAVAWVRAAGREWRETEHGAVHGPDAGHGSDAGHGTVTSGGRRLTVRPRGSRGDAHGH
ncbi:MAG TPA: hypothetical protein VHK06_04270 [Candidatus Limnocylindria bacterium]|nr:hypothetical protein [Candidatus Limnocylindria bacterium]